MLKQHTLLPQQLEHAQRDCHHHYEPVPQRCEHSLQAPAIHRNVGGASNGTDGVYDGVGDGDELLTIEGVALPVPLSLDTVALVLELAALPLELATPVNDPDDMTLADADIDIDTDDD